MSKDQYTVHDDPTMKPKTLDLSFSFKGERIKNHVTDIAFPGFSSAREFIDTYVKGVESSTERRIESIEYWVNVKADK